MKAYYNSTSGINTVYLGYGNLSSIRFTNTKSSLSVLVEIIESNNSFVPNNTFFRPAQRLKSLLRNSGKPAPFRSHIQIAD
jgi:hypothetical protein